MAFELTPEGELYYRLDEQEYVDADAYDMLRSNDTRHILAPALLQTDGARTLMYDTAEMQPANAFFAEHVFDLQQLVTILLGINEAFIEAHEYMLQERAFAGSIYYLYLNEQLDTRLVYTPVMGYEGCPGARAFILDMFVEMRYDLSHGDTDSLARINEALIQADSFSPQRFRKILTSLRLNMGSAVSTHESDQGASADGQELPTDAPVVEEANLAGANASDVASDVVAPEDAAAANPATAEEEPKKGGLLGLFGGKGRQAQDGDKGARKGLRLRKRDGEEAALADAGAGAAQAASTSQPRRRTPVRRGEPDVATPSFLVAPSDGSQAASATGQGGADEGDEEVRSFGNMLIPTQADMAAGVIIPSGGIQQDEPEPKQQRGGLLGRRKKDDETAGEEAPRQDAANARRGADSRAAATTQQAAAAVAQPSQVGVPSATVPVASSEGLTALNASRGVAAYAILSLMSIAVGLVSSQLTFLLPLALVSIAVYVFQVLFLYRMVCDVDVACTGDGKEKRPNPVLFVLLSFVTLGIYFIVKQCQLAGRMQRNAPRYSLSFKQSGVNVALLVVVLPLFLALIPAALGVMVGQNFLMLMVYGAFTGSIVWVAICVVYVVLDGLGPILAMRTLVKNCNALCAAYNAEHGLSA